MDIRRRYRWAATWLLVCSGGHFAGHYMFYMRTAGFTEQRLQTMRAMQSLIVFEPMHVSLWTVLQMFSLMFAVLLAVLGVTHWQLSKEARCDELKRHAWRNVFLFALALVLLFLLAPVPQTLIICAVASLLFYFTARVTAVADNGRI